jgi:hypothetical protein
MSAIEQAITRYFGGQVQRYENCRLFALEDLQTRLPELLGAFGEKDWAIVRKFCHEFETVFLTMGWKVELSYLVTLHAWVRDGTQDVQAGLDLAQRLEAALKVRMSPPTGS